MSHAERKLEEESGRMMGTFQLNKGRGEGVLHSLTFKGGRRRLLTWRPREEERAWGQKTGWKTRL